jgi:hypothetical protein
MLNNGRNYYILSPPFLSRWMIRCEKRALDREKLSRMLSGGREMSEVALAQ